VRRLREKVPALPAAGEDAPGAGEDRTGSEPGLDAVRQGRPVTAAVVAEVRDLIAADDLAGATSIAAALTADPGTRDVGHLCFGIVSFQRGYVPLAWQHFSATPLELWSRHAAFEYVRAGLQQDQEAALRSVRDLVDRAPGFMNAKRWLDVVGPVFGAGARELTEELVAVLDETMARQPSVSEGVQVRREWIGRWINRAADSPTAPSTGADVAFAIMDYDHPGRGRASANIGDHVQTLASLGHLVRHQELRFQGAPELVDLVGGLQQRASWARGARAGPDREPRRDVVRRSARGHLDAGVRLVHACAVRPALRLPVPQERAPHLRLVPLQQAQPADARGARLPP
jgi:hypothetical protein